MHRTVSWSAVAVGVAVLAAACATAAPVPTEQPRTPEQTDAPAAAGTPSPRGAVTLAFAGDIHFQLQVADLLDDPRGLGPTSRALAGADVAMVNLESAVTRRGTPDPKQLENAEDRYWFRTPPAALDFLADAGVDVVTLANNHGADYGPVGLRDTLRAARTGPVAVVGVGRDRDRAFAAHRVTVRGTDLAFLAADASPLESTASTWSAAPGTPGIAAAREARPQQLLAAVRRSARTADVVVVYLHWGREGQGCPTAMQRATARALSRAGADVVVGSHAHVLLGSGWLGDTYVGYGLGNFLWYHDREPDTGVLQLTVEDGAVVADDWAPARIQPWGRPVPLSGREATQAVADWRALRGCARLAPEPGGEPVPAYDASVSELGPALRARMRSSHRPGCPVGLSDLRHLRLPYVGFDGRERLGEMVVAAEHAADVVRVFDRLHRARWPIRRMRLVDAYGGDDDRSMAADNTSAYNCRRVAGTDRWSDHAFGAAIDLNPVRNPYVTGDGVAPPRGRAFADVDRSARARVPRGVIHADDVVVRAFEEVGWEWGGTWADPDYQHFSAAGD
ncbi:CapA family protein [Nocardioides euryhalodurans]|uniref:Capsule synthesis protein CapA domain-containing protein n=1 Tax=Nocardioides euryhalodurans TaxID=2518370 RepID=A0A4P7GNU4_9ACTN|nr:CapA family protein [Nocardioides euryhalodurans]QBR93898.1 hypothetical protein EXE57_17620 [Nocardioides euryhalodurans]